MSKVLEHCRGSEWGEVVVIQTVVLSWPVAFRCISVSCIQPFGVEGDAILCSSHQLLVTVIDHNLAYVQAEGGQGADTSPRKEVHKSPARLQEAMDELDPLVKAVLLGSPYVVFEGSVLVGGFPF